MASSLYIQETVDILDCNGGSHGHPFATNFNPEINIREITQRGRFFEDGEWKETDPLSVKIDFDFPGVGVRSAYLMYHEELESLALHLPGVQRIRFWMTFSESYLTHLKVLENVGMTRIDPVIHNGVEIIPIQFLKTLYNDKITTYENKVSNLDIKYNQLLDKYETECKDHLNTKEELGKLKLKFEGIKSLFN